MRNGVKSRQQTIMSTSLCSHISCRFRRSEYSVFVVVSQDQNPCCCRMFSSSVARLTKQLTHLSVGRLATTATSPRIISTVPSKSFATKINDKDARRLKIQAKKKKNVDKSVRRQYENNAMKYFYYCLFRRRVGGLCDVDCSNHSGLARFILGLQRGR